MSRINVSFTVISETLLPPDAVLQSSEDYGPTYRLTSGDYVVVTPYSNTLFPTKPHISPYDKYAGRDIGGNPIYRIFTYVPTAGGSLTDIVCIPTLDGKFKRSAAVPAPAGFTSVGIDPGIVDENGIPATVYQSDSDPSLFVVPGLTAIDPGSVAPPFGNNTPTTSVPLTAGQLSIGSQQTIWLAPVDPVTRTSLVTSGGMDFNDVFSSHSSWESIGSSVGVLMLNSDFILYAADQQIKNLFLYLRSSKLKFALETGVVSVLKPGDGGVYR